MCSHILSDIEVLCDRVAILKRGQLAHIGYLDELRRRAGDSNFVEVVATGTNAETLSRHLQDGERFMVSPTPSGLRIQVPDEGDVDLVIAALRKAGGKLVSVQPVRQSLEELFLDDE
jgi:ABC-2 type transport system ATP-binding protein